MSQGSEGINRLVSLAQTKAKNDQMVTAQSTVEWIRRLVTLSVP